MDSLSRTHSGLVSSSGMIGADGLGATSLVGASVSSEVFRGSWNDGAGVGSGTVGSVISFSHLRFFRDGRWCWTATSPVFQWESSSVGGDGAGSIGRGGGAAWDAMSVEVTEV